MNLKDKLEIVKLLGFYFKEIEVISEEDDFGKMQIESISEEIDVYENSTHRLRHWKRRNEWSLRNIKTTSTCAIYTFENAMYHYFNDLTKK